MLSSLRSRLWLSYAFLIATALGIVTIILLLFLWRNPLLYRQTEARLSAAAEALTNPDAGGLSLQVERLDALAQALSVRIVLLSPDGRVLYDSQPQAPALLLPTRRPLLQNSTLIRDASGKAWLFSQRPLLDGRRLVVAALRPRVPVLAIFGDELFPPLLGGGLLALLLALGLAFWISRWVADPLQQVIAAARAFPSAPARPVPQRGPREVRELTRVFNAMMQRVQAAQQSQRAFVANVSHELKTPLTSIQGFAQAILDGTADSTQALRQSAEVIYAEAARLHRLVLDLLDLARLDAGVLELKMCLVDVSALLNHVTERFMPMASAAGVQIIVHASSRLPTLLGDGDRLAQVFINLVDNALKFTPSGGMITLRAVHERGEIHISVSDTGKGIPAEALGRVFERFYRADSARSGGKGQGFGLGLAIAKEIIEAHGGRISVRSAEGRGTAFIVHLPVRPAA